MSFPERFSPVPILTAGAGFFLLVTGAIALEATPPQNRITAPAESFYPVGFAWERNLDWKVRDASDAGSTVGNPVRDTFGNAVWHYGSISGGAGRTSANPWYLLTSVPMEWNPDSLETGTDGSWKRDSALTTPSSSRLSL